MVEKAGIISRRGSLGIWAIPLLALLMGIYIVVQQVRAEGPTIQIAFSTAAGLEQGKTKVKYRDMDMGRVEEVLLNDNFDGIIAQVKLNKQATALLREDTQFWVVTARVGVGSITGLDTLVSGAYIQLSPGEGEEGQRDFVALDRPPLTPTGAAGIRLELTSDRASGVSAGDDVLYNGYRVGRVESMEFTLSDRKAHYVIFIDAPFHELVNTSVRFWDVSGISLTADAEGVKLETGSIYTVLLGGVAFGLPQGISPGSPVSDNTNFILYDSHEETGKNPYRHGSHYVVSFNQTMKGLAPGAPVEYRGIRIGVVEKILLKESIEQSVGEGADPAINSIPVLIYIEPGRVELPDQPESIETFYSLLQRGVSNGLRATLETGNLLSGAKYISIDYFSNTDVAEMGMHGEYVTIPTIDTGLGQIQQKLVAILDKVNSLPLNETVDRANSAFAKLEVTLEGLQQLVADQNTKQIPSNLNHTLEELRSTLQGLSPESALYQSANSNLLQLSRTLNNLEIFTRTLAEKPNSIILPSDSAPDISPRAQKR